LVPLRPCLINNNSAYIKLLNHWWQKNSVTGEVSPLEQISTIPKWLTVLENPDGIHICTNEFKQSKNRKMKLCDRFADKYDSLFRDRMITLLFFTFTRMDFACRDIASMVDIIKKHLEALKCPVRGYLWVLEVKENEKMDTGFHLHYHVIVAIDRIYWKHIPECLKFEDQWGQITGVGFVRKGVRAYTKKYFCKSEARLLKRRSYGISQKLL